MYQKILKRNWRLYQISEKLYSSISDENETRKVIALYVMAPVMCMYVLWVLEEALKSGRKRLYFLARDGYSMYQTAKIFCDMLELPIECKYLYCSRYAWRIAEYHLLQEKSLGYICLGGIDVTLEKVMHRAGLTNTEGLKVAELLHREEEFSTPLSYGQVKSLRFQLANCSYFMERMLQHSEDKYPLVCGYLRQEGLLGEDSWAIVDSGWTGSMQKSLQHILESIGYQGKVEGYYFGMYEYPSDIDKSLYHTWFFSPKEALRHKVYFSNSLFECIFSSPEGMTVGYRVCGDKYFPVLEYQESPNKAKINRSTDCLKQYAGSLVALCGRDILRQTGDGTEIAFSLLYYFMGKPALEEALEYGSYVFCDDVIGEKDQRVAAALTYQEVKENRLLYKGRNFVKKQGVSVKESAWLEGSIMLLDEAGSRELRHCAAYKYVLYLRKLMK